MLKDEKPKDIIIQINDTAQDGRDISWLWDVDFQYLADSSAARIITAGTRRLRYGTPPEIRGYPLRDDDGSEGGRGGLRKERYEESVRDRELFRSVPDKPYACRAGERRHGRVMKLTIGHLYPDLLNLYGDRGNIQCFRKSLNGAGIEAEVIPFLVGDEIDFTKLDIVLLGGGSDREQELVCGFLQNIKDDFRDYVEDGGVVLAVCGGYQLLGKYYKTDKKTIEGLGVLNITTDWEPERLIRDIVLESPLFDRPVVGFENHGGRTEIGDHTPFEKWSTALGIPENPGMKALCTKM